MGSFEFLDLIGKLHEGVADESAWSSGLDSLYDLLRVDILLLGTIDQMAGRCDFEPSRRMNPDAFVLLSGLLNNPDDNPWLARLPDASLRRPITAGDLGQHDLERSRVWNEVYVPFGVGASAAAVLERQPDATQFVVIGRFLPDLSFRPADLSGFAAILSHLARSWRVRRTLAEWRNRAGTLKFILDRLERAVIVTGPDGQLRFANRAADRLLSRGEGIDARSGRVRASRAGHTGALLTLIEAAARTGTGSADVAVDALALPCNGASPPLAVVAEPLAPPHGEALGLSSNAGAILFISNSETCRRPSADRLAAVYRLTPTEARLASMIVAGESLASAAAQLRISRNTAKYHLKAIFGKTGVIRQSQLVRRVLADLGGLAEPEKMQPAS